MNNLHFVESKRPWLLTCLYISKHRGVRVKRTIIINLYLYFRVELHIYLVAGPLGTTAVLMTSSGDVMTCVKKGGRCAVALLTQFAAGKKKE